MIKFDNVSKSYSRDHTAVKALNVEINKGEFFVIIGPSGCGKTTLLKMINRLIPVTEGTIWIQQQKISDYNIHELRWRIGYVLQQIALFPHMTIAENIAIVPALAADPDIILMDEPFSALDPISRTKLQDDLLEMQRTIQKTIVFVSHDMQEALKLGDRLCLMKDGEIVQVGTPHDILQNPANDFVRQFIGIKEDIANLFDIQTVMQPIVTSQPLDATVLADASLVTILEQLAQHDSLAVEKEGERIGSITRASMLQYLAKEYGEGGAAND